MKVWEVIDVLPENAALEIYDNSAPNEEGIRISMRNFSPKGEVERYLDGEVVSMCPYNGDVALYISLD